MAPEKSRSILPSANWLALQKKLPSASTSKSVKSEAHARKKRKTEHNRTSSDVSITEHSVAAETSFVRGKQANTSTTAASVATVAVTSNDDVKNGESLLALRKLINGELKYTPHQQQPGKYLALDCEMVGVGIDGKESSLARVSLVNYHGAVILDEFVRQRERVVDYRTEFSGIRPSDMVNAKPFAEIQQQVAELLKDRILVGHAVHNDLKALLLSHPRHQTRDTQIEASKHKLTKSRRPALRHLVQQELNIAIQEGEHSSVTDARATMAIYRLHRKEWDKGHPPVALLTSAKKRKRSASAAPDEGESDDSKKKKKQKAVESFPGGGRKGISSGLSTVIKRRGSARQDASVDMGSSSGAKKSKTQWWKELGTGSNGSKGSIRLKAG
ncbi:ribonuclease H-like protein [Panus rudis PR-1116 ss-1]|nr:ribonuclease H-like protein [Panus rudis PR-1116 ss-1]